MFFGLLLVKSDHIAMASYWAVEIRPAAAALPILPDAVTKCEAVCSRQPLVVPPAFDITDMDFSEGLLRIYYDRFFPYEQMFNWLAYFQDPKSDNPVVRRDFFSLREWSFTIGEVYIRFLTFHTLEEFKAGIQSKQPHKIDIGAVYTTQASKHNTVKKDAFKPVQRELVFDIDLTDYDDVRTCCSGATICNKCWQYMNVAIKVLDTGLREDFGFKNILFIYSGRRGVHCWVCDEEARNLTNHERTAVVEYFSAVSGGSDESSKQAAVTYPLVPCFERAFAMLEHFFTEWVITEKGQGILESEEHWGKVLDMVPEVSGLKAKVERAFKTSDDATERWERLKEIVNNRIAKLKQSEWSERKRLRTVVAEIVFVFCYPRIDEAVTKGMNHLLKSPFCVHPKTGRVCVAIDPAEADTFDPFAVPTIGALAKELNAGTPADRTSLAAYLEVFERKFLRGLRADVTAAMREKSRARSEGTCQAAGLMLLTCSLRYSVRSHLLSLRQKWRISLESGELSDYH